MIRVIKYICISFIFSFIFIINTKAECSYQERKELLNAAKNIDITVEPKTEIIETTGTTSFSDGEVVIKSEKYTFDFLISNLPDTVYIRYYNGFNSEEGHIVSSSLENGIYRLKAIDSNALITYYFEVRSKNSNCSGDVISTKKVVKPIYNYYSEYAICEEEALSNKDYCKKFITKDLNLTESEFLNKASKVLEESHEDEVQESFNLLNFIKTYWYIFVSIIGLILLIVVIIIIKKRRERLV